MVFKLFANEPNPTGPQLDSDLQQLGFMGVMPCTVSGAANALVLTPDPDKPLVAAYANYMTFSGIAVSTNNSATTIQVGALPALNAYKDTLAGPVALAGSEIVQFCEFQATYDLALNSGAGGFHVRFGTPVSNSPIAPSTIGIFNAGTTLTNINSGTITVPFTVVPAASVQEQIAGTGLSNGVLVGDAIIARYFAGVPANALFMEPYVKGTNSIALRVGNVTAASLSAFTVTVGFIGFRAVP